MSDDTATATETSDAPNIFAHIENPIKASDDEGAVRAATTEQRQKRERDWENGIGPDNDPFAEQRSPVVERRWGEPGAIKLKDAQSGLSNQKKLESGQRYLAELNASDAGRTILRNAGVDEITDPLAFEVADVAARVGKKPSELPTEKIGVANNFGKVHAPLDDLTPIDGSHGGNLREVTRASRNFRELAALQQQQLLAELEQQPAVQQQPAPQTAQPQPAPSPQPQRPQQPTQADIERQRFEIDRRMASELKALSTGEINAYVGLNQLEQAWRAIPETQSKELANQTFSKNPARWQQIEAAAQEYQQRKAALTVDYHRHNQGRMIREAQLAQYQHAQTQAAVIEHNKKNDAVFDEWFRKEFPEHKLSEVSKYARQALLNSGADEARINELWQNGALRGAETQRILAKAGLFEMAQERMRSITNNRASVPQVQRPGTVRPRGADSEEAIRGLERRLENSSGAESLRLSVALQRARRNAGYA